MKDFKEITGQLSSSEEFAKADFYVRMAHKSTGRSYWAFSAMVVISAITLIAVFNEYFSYDRIFFKYTNLALRENVFTDSIAVSEIKRIHGDSVMKVLAKDNIDIADTIPIDVYQELVLRAKRISNDSIVANVESIPFKKLNPVSEELRNNFIRNSLDSRFITIPLLGVKISSSDILILIGLAYLIISFWLFICIRSENFTIGKILILAQDKSIEVRRYVFYGICFNNMFFPTTLRRTPYDDLSKFNRTLDEELDELPTKLRRKPILSRIVDFALDKSFYMPLIVLLGCYIVHIIDVMYLLDGWPLDVLGRSFEKKVMFGNWNSVFSKEMRFDFSDLPEIAKDFFSPYLKGVLFCASALLLIIGYFNCQSARYQRGTSLILRSYKRRFKHDDDCIKCMKHNELTGENMEVFIVKMDQRLLLKGTKNATVKKFGSDYSRENGYFLLTHTGYKNKKKDYAEVKRICDLLQTREDNLWPHNFTLPKDNRRICNYTEQEDLERTKWEYFIFLKTVLNDKN